MSSLNIYEEIARLLLTAEEKTFLRNYFINNCQQKTEVVEVLSTCETDQEKFDFLKSFLESCMYQYVKITFLSILSFILYYFTILHIYWEENI